MQSAVGVREEKIVAGWVVAAMFIYVHKYNKHFSNIDTLFLNCIGSQKKDLDKIVWNPFCIWLFSADSLLLK